MCDTLIRQQNGVMWFAKNSDREPTEPQRLIRHAAVSGDRAKTVQTTYMTLPQSARRHGVILSQPSWMWGAEIGVNDRGVVIGNEAVFTRCVMRQGQALLGMDLLRLALERGDDAQHALQVIVEHLQRYGQGGPAGHRNKRFRYDNSFLIADANNAWVLETAGAFWAAKRVHSYAISNALTIGADYDLSSDDLPAEARRQGFWNGRGEFSFARAFDTRFMPVVGGARQRRQANLNASACSAEVVDWRDMFAALRSHGSKGDRFSRHNNRQVCMHARDILRPSQTTASMVVRLQSEKIGIMATGTSAPCLSLFQPLSFDPASGGALLSDPDQSPALSPWWRFEPIHARALVDSPFRTALRRDRDACEARLLSAMATTPNWSDLAEIGRHWLSRWQSEAATQAPVKSPWGGPQ